MITEAELCKTWFLVAGRLDEIVMTNYAIGDARDLAIQLRARFYFRRTEEHPSDMSYDWSVYEITPADLVVSWKGHKIHPIKIIRSPTIDAAHMYVLAKGSL